MDDLDGRIDRYLRALCVEVDDRHVGGVGNRAATRLFAEVCEAAGFEVSVAELPCIEWDAGECSLSAGGRGYGVLPGPYSPAYHGTARLATASSVEEIEAVREPGAVLLLHGEITGEQLMPKNFAFYNPESHRRIIAALEAAAPVAVIAATGIDPDTAGGAYPFPLIEDGDFDIPNAYMTDLDGESLVPHAGGLVEVHIESARRPAVAEQPVASKSGSLPGRVLLFAHIDSKDGTPGALDNATGVAALLGVAELLSEIEVGRSIELWPLNGEDYYAATGQMYFLERNEGRLDDVVLGINVDGAGRRGDGIAVSTYGLPLEMAGRVQAHVEGHGFVSGPQWPQGDHSMLTMNGVPALALTSTDALFVASTVAHTPSDTYEQVDVGAVADVARFIAAVALDV